MNEHLFVAGVPATGKSWLGQWLAETKGYVHIDAERDGGIDFDRAGLHEHWDEVIATGSARRFAKALCGLGKPVIVNWGLPTRYLYVVTALREAGIRAVWVHGDREHARTVFIRRRGGIDPLCFERQMDDIAREWSLIALVFGPNVVQGLHPDGSQRRPEEIWGDITVAG